jgi:hypothetical protein
MVRKEGWGQRGHEKPDAWAGRDRGSERRHPRSPSAPLTAVSGASRGERRNTEHKEYLLNEGKERIGFFRTVSLRLGNWLYEIAIQKLDRFVRK